MPSLLEVRGLSVRYGTVLALRDVDLKVSPGELVGVFGPNGSGKTTLLDAICGIQRPTAGHVELRGVSIGGRAPWDIARRGVARTFQIAKPLGSLTAGENLRVGLTFGASAPPRGAVRLRRETEHLLARVGLEGRADVPAHAFSLGDRKRLELALALSTQPMLLLLDELAAGLSPRGRTEVMRFYGRLRNSGLAIIAVEHSVSALADVADRLVLLSQGAVTAQGTPHDVLTAPQVAGAYLGDGEP